MLIRGILRKRQFQFTVVVIAVLFLSIIVVREIQPRIIDGERGRVAIVILDDVRRPFLGIQKTVSTLLTEGYGDGVQAQLEREVERGQHLIAEFQGAAAYNPHLLQRVETLASAYEDWLGDVHVLFAVAQQNSLENADNLFNTEIAADAAFSHVMALLGDAEGPIHEDVEDGHQATVEMMGLGGTLLVAVLAIAFLRLSSRNSVLVELMAESVRAEKTLIAAKEEAELANRAKSQFLSSMSHELRTPLNAIMGLGQLMQNRQDEPLTSRQKVHTDHIIDAGSILLQLINEILDLARIETGQLHLSMEDIYASDIIAESIALVLPTSDSHDIPVTNHASNHPPILIHADALRLKQVLLNLLSNAVKYNKPGGTVSLDAHKTDDGYLNISVTDNGIGISPEHHADVFKPFQRLGIEAIKTVEGTGIGLTVTEQLVEQMGGRIGFESEEHKGSTFWVEIPLATGGTRLLWSERLSVGIEQIDDDHKVLIALLDRASARGLSEEEVDGIIAELIDYTLYHFRHEEAIMEACGYLNLEDHRTTHRKLTARAEEFAEQWRKDRSDEVIQDLLDFLRTWLVEHIMTEDAEIQAFAEGRKAEIDQALERFSNTEQSNLLETFETQVSNR